MVRLRVRMAAKWMRGCCSAGHNRKGTRDYEEGQAQKLNKSILQEESILQKELQ